MLMRRTEHTGGNDDSERRLLARIAVRDRDALSRLYLAYHGRLFKFVYRLSGSYTIAEELVNDTMMTVWQKADSFRGASKVSTWIFGIAWRQTMRRLSRNKLRFVDFDDLDTLPATGQTNVDRENWIQRGLQALPPDQRTTVILVFYLGLTYRETAEITDCPVNTVKTRMFHARKKLKKLLDTAAKPVERAQSERGDKALAARDIASKADD